ncbi:sensor histidine kinase [Deinococcus peraridilitoris]|uniref:sensor histidine kinase n=1 Tax=Deinococcus peraridilitoris TaxID=432329 RepID=UPI0002FC479B|nr:ATP-binding protein [Deinococcus peraridilitoris]
MRDAWEDLRPDWEDRAVTWCVRDLPSVQGDAELLRQVLANLLGNALKYTSRNEVAQVEVGAEVQGDEVVVFVRDNGSGFDPRFGDKLFAPFSRLHRLEEFEGAGLGLANVKRIVTRHGGRVWAEGKPNEGATFWFSLPREFGSRPFAAQTQ